MSELFEATTVYVARTARGAVLYVGITGRNLRRLHAHARSSEWWPKARRIELRHCSTRTEALDLERELIERWRPDFNTVHKPRGASGLLTADEIAGILGLPPDLARHVVRKGSHVTINAKRYAYVDDVRAWLDEHLQVTPREVRT